MKNKEVLNRLNLITCYLLVFLFTYTGISKLIDHSAFLSSLLQSTVIRNQASFISWFIPIFELLTVVLLLSNKYSKIGLLFSLLLLIIFTLYIAYMILFVPHLPCSCGGVLKELSWSNHILFNSFFILLIVISLFSTKHKLFIAINRTSRKPV